MLVGNGSSSVATPPDRRYELDKTKIIIFYFRSYRRIGVKLRFKNNNHKQVQWNLLYSEVLGTMKTTLLYQVSHHYQGKKTKKYKELGPAK